MQFKFVQRVPNDFLCRGLGWGMNCVPLRRHFLHGEDLISPDFSCDEVWSCTRAQKGKLGRSLLQSVNRTTVTPARYARSDFQWHKSAEIIRQPLIDFKREKKNVFCFCKNRSVSLHYIRFR